MDTAGDIKLAQHELAEYEAALVWARADEARASEFCLRAEETYQKSVIAYLESIKAYLECIDAYHMAAADTSRLRDIRDEKRLVLAGMAATQEK